MTIFNKIKLFVLFILILLTSFCISQDRRVDSLNKLLATAKHDTLRAQIYFALTESLYLNNLDTVVPLCEKALAIIDKSIKNANSAEKSAFLKIKANSLGNIGYVQMEKGNMKEALDFLLKAIEINKQIGNKRGIAIGYNNIGNSYDRLGDISGALDFYHKALKMQEELDDKYGIATTLNNIGFIFMNQNDLVNALDYYKRSLKLREELNERLSIAYSLNNMGLVFQRMSENAEKNKDKKGRDSLNKMAIHYWEKSLAIHNELGDNDGIATSLHNLSLEYYKRGETAKGIEYAKNALNIVEKLGNKKSISHMLNNIGDMYFKLKEFKSAEQFCERALAIASELGFPLNIRNASRVLCQVYREEARLPGVSLIKKNELLEKAYATLHLHKTMSDSVNNKEMQKKALKKQIQHEYEKKETIAKAEQNKKDAIAEQEKQKQKFIMYSVCLILLLISVFALFVFRSYRQKQKANIEITEQKNVIEEKQKEILSSIRYAKRIQQSLLPMDKYIDKSIQRLKK